MSFPNNITKRIDYSLILLSILFLFFFQLISDYVESTYAIELLSLSLDENSLSLLFLFSPVLLLFLKNRWKINVLIVTGLIIVLCRLLESLLILHFKMFISGLGVGSFLVFFPVYLQTINQGKEEENAIDLGIALVLAISGSILLRTLGSSFDISTYGITQLMGWILGGIAVIILISWKKTFIIENKIIQPANLKNSKIKNKLKQLGLIIATMGIVVLIYFTFISPTVISRWAEKNYVMIIFLLIFVLAFHLFGISLKNDLLSKIPLWMIFLTNVIFFISLLATIIFNQVNLPLVLSKYPIYAPETNLISEITVLITILLSPILLTDFTIIQNEILIMKYELKQIAIYSFFSSLFLIIMIFAQIFTTTYDYIPIIGPIFRDKFWMVFLVLSLSIFLPLLTIRSSSLKFKPRVLNVKQRLNLIIMIFLMISTILGAFLTSPNQINVETPSSIKVITYNIQQGNSEGGIKNFLGQLEVLKKINADIIGLQESDIARISGGNSDIVRFFANSLNLYSYYGPSTVTGTFGIALLSKYPIVNAKTFFMYSQGEQTATIEAQIEINSRLFNIFVTHLGNGGPIEQQINILSRLEGRNNVILMGDFNFQPYSSQYNLTTSNLFDSWLTSNSSLIDGNNFNLETRIDHIFVSNDINVSECWYIVNNESDHPALWINIQL